MPSPATSSMTEPYANAASRKSVSGRCNSPRKHSSSVSLGISRNTQISTSCTFTQHGVLELAYRPTGLDFRGWVSWISLGWEIDDYSSLGVVDFDVHSVSLRRRCHESYSSFKPMLHTYTQLLLTRLKPSTNLPNTPPLPLPFLSSSSSLSTRPTSTPRTSLPPSPQTLLQGIHCTPLNPISLSHSNPLPT